MTLKKIFYILIASLFFLFSIILGVKYWYTGEWKDGIDFFASGIIIIGWAIALALLMWAKLIKYKIPLLPIVVLIISIVIIDSTMSSLKIDQILKDKGTTKGNVTFVGSKYRRGYGITYTYKVNNVIYEKWDSNEEFIKENKLIVGDTFNIVYSRKNPDMHEFEKLIEVK
jgi:hypothetical protein